MCKHCDKETNKFVCIDGGGSLNQGYILGDPWGRAGFSRAKSWVHKSVLIQTRYDKKFRIMSGDVISSPIAFCPKCGRKLDATS